MNTHPLRYPLHIPPSVYKVDYRDVEFTVRNGIVLKVWFIRPMPVQTAAPAIIVCHGVNENKSDFTELAVHLPRRGYAVLLFDFRAHGESGGGRTSLGYHEQDVEGIASPLPDVIYKSPDACCPDAELLIHKKPHFLRTCKEIFQKEEVTIHGIFRMDLHANCWKLHRFIQYS